MEQALAAYDRLTGFEFDHPYELDAHGLSPVDAIAGEELVIATIMEAALAELLAA